MYQAYAYFFDCKQFIYNERVINGLGCAIKTNQLETQEIITENVSVTISQKSGFQILVNCKVVDVVIQPYEIYFLALCDNDEEETIVVTYETLMQYKEFIIDGTNHSAEASWTLQ